MAYSNNVRKLAGWIFVIYVLTTAVLFVFLNRTRGKYESQNRAAQNNSIKTKQQLLNDLQRTIFLHPDRPPDSVYQINVTLSESIPLVRDIPDTRPEACRAIKYDLDKLPRISIIIPFYNEALSLLLRTVHSILQRTTPALLAEIILIDDHSHNKDLGATLDEYVSYLPKVQLIRLPQREGLIRARMIALHRAKGEVIMFQDAHIENNVGWAEPILELIRKDKTTIVQPFIHRINAAMQYVPVDSWIPRVGFSWELEMFWLELPRHEKHRIEKEGMRTKTSLSAVPIRTPIVLGCAIAVDKEYFLSIGGFDEGLDVWGGENIETGFQNWMCGGQVLTHPCSRIGHVYREFPYSFDGDRDKIITKNLMRVAEVWMGDWKKYFLASTYTFPFKHVHFSERDLKSLDKRKALREKLKCKSFDWYMKNIIPEIPAPDTDIEYFGEVSNLHTKESWAMADDGYVTLSAYSTEHMHVQEFSTRQSITPENHFYIDNEDRLKHWGKCLRIEQSTWMVKYGECEEERVTEKWSVVDGVFKDGLVQVNFTSTGGKRENRCVAVLSNTFVTKVHYKKSMPMLVPCDRTNDRMHWRWTYRFSWDYYLGPPGMIPKDRE